VPTPRPEPPKPRELTEVERRRVDAAVTFVVDSSFDGWSDAIASRCMERFDSKTWNRLFGRRRAGDCDALAKTARALIKGKKKLHEITGSVTGKIAHAAGVDPLGEAVVRELAKRVPLPGDQKVTAAARGLQVIGVAVCVAADRPLNECQCFIDLALDRINEQLKGMLDASIKDWGSSSSEAVKSWAAAELPPTPWWP